MASTEINRIAKREAEYRIQQFYPAYKQRNAALGIGFSPEQTAQMVNFIERVIARCDEYEAAENPVIDYSDILP